MAAGTPVHDLFERVCVRMLREHPGDERGRMLRASGLRTAGSFYAFVGSDDDLIVKLPAERVTALVATGVGRPCQTGRGRPMREWVLLTPRDEASCADFVAEARDFVRRLGGR